MLLAIQLHKKKNYVAYFLSWYHFLAACKLLPQKIKLMFMKIEANVHELQLWCCLSFQVTESVLWSQVFSELQWFCHLQQCDSHQNLVSKDISWSCGSADNKLICHLIPSMCLHNNSFWKMLDFFQKGVARQNMSVCCHIFHCDLLFIFLMNLVNMVFLNVARFIQTGCVWWFVFCF